MNVRSLAVVAAFLLAGCTKNSVTQDFAVAQPGAYADLLTLDPLSTSDTSKYRIAATSVKVESVPNEKVVWRIMAGDDELFRYIADLSTKAGSVTEIALSLDRSHAPESTVNPALTSETERLDKGRRLSIMAEKIAATIQHRSFEEARVDVRLKDFAVDDKAEQAVMVAKVPAMAASALGQYAEMRRDIAQAEAEQAKRAAATSVAPPSDAGSSGRPSGYEPSPLHADLPMTAAEAAAERQRNR